MNMQARSRRVTEEELKSILASHQVWLETKGGEGAQANLEGAYLSGANLQGAALRQAKLQEADLGGANLSGAKLQGAYLSGANLQGAALRQAKLQEADLGGANLSGAKLQEADLGGAFLISANLDGARLIDANLQSAYLIGANLQEANLERAYLAQANLLDANLQSADLRGANLQGANLNRVGLQEADLRNTTFEPRIATEGGESVDLEAADLTEADLSNANLSDAKLSGVMGLVANKLAGANLSNATLPKDIATFDGLARAAEASRIARPMFIGILAGCLYSWLTIATTTDQGLLNNTASSPLPIIGAKVPIAGFYWAAPIILLGVYFYFHLYLQRLWAGLADLPAVFPDGRPLDKKVYPWLLSGLVRAHFQILQGERTLLSRLENWIVILLAWWIVPFTIAVFWGRYLSRDDWFGTGLHIALLAISIGCAILLYCHAVRTLRGTVTAFCWRNPWLDRRSYQAAVALGLGVLFALISFGTIECGLAPIPWTVG